MGTAIGGNEMKTVAMEKEWRKKTDETLRVFISCHNASKLFQVLVSLCSFSTTVLNAGILLQNEPRKDLLKCGH